MKMNSIEISHKEKYPYYKEKSIILTGDGDNINIHSTYHSTMQGTVSVSINLDKIEAKKVRDYLNRFLKE